MNLARAGGAVEHQPAGFGSTAPVTDPHANTPQEACRGPASFDWKKRSSKIHENVKKAGLNPLDYGFNSEVYNHSSKADFSWRGYTNMVCNRLATNAEPGMPEKMGCPPASWNGWRS